MWDFYSGGPRFFQVPQVGMSLSQFQDTHCKTTFKIRGLRKVYCPLHGIFFSCIGLSFNIFQKFAIKTVTAQIHWLGMISYTCKIKVLNQKAWNWGLTGWQYINHNPFLTCSKCKTTVKTLHFCQLNPALPRH